MGAAVRLPRDLRAARSTPALNSRKMFVDAIVNDSLETLTEWQTKHSLFPAE